MKKEQPIRFIPLPDVQGTEGDFGPDDIKMSANATTLVLGSREIVGTGGELNNTNGIHVYSRNANIVGKTCSGKVQSEWSFVQSLKTDNAEDPLQVVQVHVSGDGSGILALSKPWCTTPSWSTEGDADWTVEGNGSLKSGVVGDGETSSLLLSNLCNVTLVQFTYNITSDDDTLTVYVDNVPAILFDPITNNVLPNPIVGTVADTTAHVFTSSNTIKWTYSQTGVAANSASVKDITINQVSVVPTTLPQRAPLPHAKLHWFERDPLMCGRAGVAKYKLCQTIENDADDVEWLSFTADENQTRIVLHKRGIDQGASFADGALDIFTRSATSLKRTSRLDKTEEALFKLAHTITPEAEESRETQLSGVYALCDDARTLMVANVSTELGSIFFSTIQQYDYDCADGTYTKVSDFSIDDNGQQLVDLKFGGACCDRLFLLLRNGFAALPTYAVQVHDRRSVEQLTSKRITSANECCSKEPAFFSSETLVTTVNDVVEPVDPLVWKPNVALYADPIDGDCFVVVLAHPKQATTSSSRSYPRKPIGGAFNMRFWRQSDQSGDVWKYRDASEAEVNMFPGSRCYSTHRFANLIFDHACQRLCFPLAQKIYPFNESISDTHFVGYTNGTFYLNQRQFLLGLQHSVWFRHPGTTTYILLPETTAQNSNNVALDLSADCRATEVELVTTENDFEYDPDIQGFVLTVRDPNLRPDIITDRYTVPLRLFFNVVCFHKN